MDEVRTVERGQLEKNPFQHVRKRKVPKRKVHIYTDDECDRAGTLNRDRLACLQY